MKIDRKEWFAIPNILGYFRILLIPFFMYFYITAGNMTSNGALALPDNRRIIAASLIVLSSLTDFLDGYIARRFNMITNLGKILDPLADKLTQGAMVVSFLTRYPSMWVLLGALIIKDGFITSMGIVLLRRNGRNIGGAKWYGKVCTVILYVVMFSVIVFPLGPKMINILVFACTVITLITFLLYLPEHVRLYREE